jgi:hypothetical protein
MLNTTKTVFYIKMTGNKEWTTYRKKYEVLLLVMLRAKIPCQSEHIQALDKNRLIKIPEKQLGDLIRMK